MTAEEAAQFEAGDTFQVLYYTIIYCTVLSCTVLYCSVLNTVQSHVLGGAGDEALGRGGQGTDLC